MTERNTLSADEFLAKVKGLVEKDAPWGSCYDIDHDQIKMMEDVNDPSTVFYSPVMCQMPDYIYHTWRRAVDDAIPDSDRGKGRYW